MWHPDVIEFALAHVDDNSVRARLQPGNAMARTCTPDATLGRPHRHAARRRENPSLVKAQTEEGDRLTRQGESVDVSTSRNPTNEAKPKIAQAP